MKNLVLLSFLIIDHVHSAAGSSVDTHLEDAAVLLCTVPGIYTKKKGCICEHAIRLDRHDAFVPETLQVLRERTTQKNLPWLVGVAAGGYYFDLAALLMHYRRRKPIDFSRIEVVGQAITHALKSGMRSKKIPAWDVVAFDSDNALLQIPLSVQDNYLLLHMRYLLFDDMQAFKRIILLWGKKAERDFAQKQTCDPSSYSYMLAWCQTYHEREGDDPEVMRELGMTYCRLGRHEQAKEVLLNAALKRDKSAERDLVRMLTELSLQ